MHVRDRLQEPALGENDTGVIDLAVIAGEKGGRLSTKVKYSTMMIHPCTAGMGFSF